MMQIAVDVFGTVNSGSTHVGEKGDDMEQEEPETHHGLSEGFLGKGLNSIRKTFVMQHLPNSVLYSMDGLSHIFISIELLHIVQCTT